jgi:hypothetical protein
LAIAQVTFDVGELEGLLVALPNLRQLELQEVQLLQADFTWLPRAVPQLEQLMLQQMHLADTQRPYASALLYPLLQLPQLRSLSLDTRFDLDASTLRDFTPPSARLPQLVRFDRFLPRSFA